MKSEFWEMLDEGDSINYMAIASFLKEDLQPELDAAKEKASEEVESRLVLAEDELYRNLDNVRQTELTYGASPETWEKYLPHHEGMKVDLRNLTEVQSRPQSIEEVDKAATQAVSSMDNASNYLNEESKKIIDRENDFKEKFEALKRTIFEMEVIAQDLPDYYKKAFEDPSKNFIKNVDEMREMAKEQRPSVSAMLLQETRDKVNETYQSVKEMPEKIKEAVKDKSYEVADKAVTKVANVFDKAIAYLEEKKQEILSLTKRNKEAEPAFVKAEKQAEPAAEKSVAPASLQKTEVKEHVRETKIQKRQLQVKTPSRESRGKELELSR